MNCTKVWSTSVLFHEQRARLCCDAVREGTNRHLEIDRQGILDVQGHVWPDELLESGLLHFDLVRSRRQICQRVLASAIGRCFIAEIGGVLTASTFSSTIVAFDGSVTRPVIDPFVVCARRAQGYKKRGDFEHQETSWTDLNCAVLPYPETCIPIRQP